MTKKNREIEIINQKDNDYKDIDVSEIHCIGCSWKGSVKKIK